MTPVESNLVRFQDGTIQLTQDLEQPYTPSAPETAHLNIIQKIRRVVRKGLYRHTSQYPSSTRRTDRIRNIAMIESHPLVGNPIQIRSVVDARSVGADGFRCVVIGHDEDDIGLLSLR